MRLAQIPTKTAIDFMGNADLADLRDDGPACSDVRWSFSGPFPFALRESTFCFVPYGDGWGSRIVHVMHGACIPIIVQV